MTMTQPSPSSSRPRIPAVMEDPALPHQIVMFVFCNDTAMSCNCQRLPERKGWAPIETRHVFPAADAIASYRSWHARQRMAV